MRLDWPLSEHLTPLAHPRATPFMRPRLLPAWALLLPLAFLLLPGATAQTPVLRIETGTHTARITRISVDRAERFAVTASVDKTARVWDLATGRLLCILRPPIGEGNEGKLYAVALSPDGNTIATAGWTLPDGLTANIYLFDRVSGQLRQRLTALPDVVFHLAYSPDGRWLAATLGAGNGVRLYDAQRGYAPAGHDTAYGTDSYGATFDATGTRLATSCFDGFLRLYAVGAARADGNPAALRLLAKRRAAGGKQPFGISFTPDGSRLAVGFDDTTAVNVLAGDDLRLLFAPDTSGVDNGDLSKVAWSGDGTRLYAGGRWQVSGKRPVRVWDAGGRGRTRDLATGANNTIHDLAGLSGGGVVYAAGEPSWGVVDATGRSTVRVVPAVADYRDNWELMLRRAELFLEFDKFIIRCLEARQV